MSPKVLAGTIRQKARASRRGKYVGNPYVPLRADRLDAAIKASGRSLEQVCRSVPKDAPCSKQSLHHLRRKGTRCRKLLRLRLANVLSVPYAFLGGEDLPVDPGQVAEEMLKSGLPPDEALRRIAERPATAVLARARFLEFTGPALRRDSLTRRDLDDKVFEGEVLSRLVDPEFWAVVLLGPDSAKSLTGDQLSEALAALARAFSIVLSPWAKGRATLNYTQLLALVSAEDAAFQPNSGSSLEQNPRRSSASPRAVGHRVSEARPPKPPVPSAATARPPQRRHRPRPTA